jgi:hypothetical protein
MKATNNMLSPTTIALIHTLQTNSSPLRAISKGDLRDALLEVIRVQNETRREDAMTLQKREDQVFDAGASEGLALARKIISRWSQMNPRIPTEDFGQALLQTLNEVKLPEQRRNFALNK